MFRQSPLPGEDQLVLRSQAGDADAFTELYDAYAERLYRYIYFRVSDEAVSEELVSQVFLKAWQSLGRFRPGGSPFIAWLYTIARNLVIDHHRAKKKDMLPLDDLADFPAGGESPDEAAEKRFDLQALRQALQHLSPDQQQVLVLKYMAGLSNAAIASIMKKQQGTIRGLHMRALQNLSRHLKGRDLK